MTRWNSIRVTSASSSTRSGFAYSTKQNWQRFPRLNSIAEVCTELVPPYTTMFESIPMLPVSAHPLVNCMVEILRSCLVHTQLMVIYDLPIDSGNGRTGFGLIFHLDESEAARTAGITVYYDRDAHYMAKGLEQRA